MYNKRELVKDIYYVGVNDRQKKLFENYIPIPNGVAYNSYLILDEKVTLIDTVDVSMVGLFMGKLEAVLQGRKIDYLVVNHMEPDHAGSIGLLKQLYPDLCIIGNAKTFGMLNGYYPQLAGCRQLVVKEGESVSLGKRKLTFYMAPMVHWPEVMVAYEDTDKILFSADAFGTFGTLDGDYLDENINTDKYWDDMRRYYACIVGKFGTATQAAIKKLSALEIRLICSTHGPVLKQNIAKVVGLFDKWSRYEAEEKGLVIAYASMYGNTQQLAEAAAEGAVAAGLKNVVVYNVSKTDASYILADIFRYNGVILAAPTYMNEIYPLMDSLMHKIDQRGILNRSLGLMGSCTWAGGALKKLTAFADAVKWELVSNPVDNKQGVSADDYQKAFDLGMAMGQKLLQ